MKGAIKAGAVCAARRMASAIAIAAVLCLPTGSAEGQHAQRPAFGPRFAGMGAQHNQNQPRMNGPRMNQRRMNEPRPNQPRMNEPRMNQPRPAFREPGREFSPYRGPAPQQGYRPGGSPMPSVRPAMPGPGYPGYTRPAYPNAGSAYAPPGHLGAWLDSHRNVAPQEQQRMLHSDPSFSRLPAQQQQRLVQQLNRVDQMPEAQRERRLARAENIERLSPQQRAQLQDSGQRWRTLPSDRQAVMKNAFRDLRNVPPDQRQTVLNSARYQNAFSPEERGILGNMLSVEPYQPER
jgi:hypothetical protein